MTYFAKIRQKLTNLETKNLLNILSFGRLHSENRLKLRDKSRDILKNLITVLISTF